MDNTGGNPPPIPPDPAAFSRAAFGLYIATKWHREVFCPICSNQQWETGEVLDLPVRYGSPGSVYSLIPVRCTNCHYTILFNGVTAGLFDAFGNPKLADAPAPQLPGLGPGQS